jgi:CheY-like chemotaxis protein
MTCEYALIAEPNASRRSFWASNLAQEGLACVATTDGEETIEVLCTSGPPVLLLVELALPIMDGFRVIDRLRRVVMPEECPVIVVSAFRELREEALLLRDRLGISLILTPQVPAEKVRQAVRGLIPGQENVPGAQPAAAVPITVGPQGAPPRARWRGPQAMRRVADRQPPSSRGGNGRRHSDPPPPPSSVC